MKIKASLFAQLKLSCIFTSVITTNTNTMKARVSNTGKVIVKGQEFLTGRGIQYRGIASNGEHSFIMTEAAYTKISNRCKWED